MYHWYLNRSLQGDAVHLNDLRDMIIEDSPGSVRVAFRTEGHRMRHKNDKYGRLYNPPQRSLNSLKQPFLTSKECYDMIKRPLFEMKMPTLNTKNRGCCM